MTAMLTPSSVRTIAVAATTTATTTTTIGKATASATTTAAATTTVMPAAALSKATTLSSIPVRAIPVPNTNKLILAGPCIVFRTATVAEQVQALRQEKKKVVAATSTATTSVKTEAPELLRCKRRADLGKLGFPEAKPVSVSRRNARERNRVKLVNQGFDTLREHVPNGKKNRKMSKVDTLKSAVDYIRQLQEMIEEHDEKMDVSGSDSSPSDVTITCDSSPLVSDDRLSEEEMSESPKNNSPTPTKTETTTMTELSVVNIANENVIKDTLNNNNNNTFVNFNVDTNQVSNVSEQDALQQVNGVPQLNTVQQVNLNQVNTGRGGNVTLQVNGSKVQVNNNNRQQVNAAQQVNTVSAQQLLTSLSSLNSTSFVNAASLISAQTASCTPSSSSSSTQAPTTATASPLPQTITLITLPIHPQPPPISPNNTADDVFLPDSAQPRIRTLAPAAGQQSVVPTGSTLATLTTLQGMGSLSGQGLTISQPCRRHLSFSEPEPERSVQIQPRLSLSEQGLLVNHQQRQQLEQSAGLLVNNQQQQQQQSPPPPPTTQQQQQHISFTLLPGQNVTGDLSLLNSNLNTNTLTLVPQQTISIDQQQNHQQHQPSTEPPHFTTLSNLAFPNNQSVNAAFSFDQSTSLPLTDNHGYHHQDQFQTLVAPSNVAAAMKQPQLQVDQVPSPSLSTSSSHTSESSYESYESLGSLEEDLQDISNWITELCNSQDIHGHCDTDDGVSFLTYSDPDNL